MTSKEKNKILFDKFGARIFCRFCKEKGYKDNHHSIECNTCYNCGTKGHIAKYCGKDKPGEQIKNTSMRRQVYIDNIDKLFPKEPVSLDVEKVQGYDGQMLPGWVCVYRIGKYSRHNKQKPDDIVYSAKIRQLKDKVSTYATPWSGLTRLDLSERAVDLTEVRCKLYQIFQNRTLVGTALRNDLFDLGINTESLELFDLQNVFRDSNDQPISLKILSYALLGKRIQEFSPTYDELKVHDPVIDSRITIKIFNKMKNFKPVDGSYQWCRDIVDDAIKSGKLTTHASKKPYSKI